MDVCSISGCGRKLLARGYCSRHYNAWRTHGSPLARTIAERGEPLQWLKVHSSFSSDACLIWPFKSKYTNGYGSIFVDGKLTGAHRAMCRLAHGGPTFANAEAAHTCGNRACVNPSHIRWATPVQNAADKVPLGRDSRGERNGSAKLSESDVIAIYARRGFATQATIAAEYGITREAVRSIHLGKTWKWLTETAA